MDANETPTTAAVDPWPEAALPDPSGEIPVSPSGSGASDPRPADRLAGGPSLAGWARGHRRLAVAGALVVVLAAGVVAVALHLLPGAAQGTGPEYGADAAGRAPTGSSAPSGSVPSRGALADPTRRPSVGSTGAAGGTGGSGITTGPGMTAAPTASADPPPDDHVYYSGYVDLTVTEDGGPAVDLETGRVATTIVGIEFDLTAATTGLVRIGDARFAVEPGTNVDPTTCAKQTWSKALPVQGLSTGAVYCVRTTDGRLGFLNISYVILGKDGSQLSTVGFGWTIWA